MLDKRTALPAGTTVVLESGSEYVISGAPIGFGGGSILYPARRRTRGGWDGLDYALKECWPVSAEHSCVRSPEGEILPSSDNDREFLLRARQKQLEEGSISRAIYRTASRMLPIREASERIRLCLPGAEQICADNTVTVMDSLSSKGRSIGECLRQKRRFTPREAFRILSQLLTALDEVHSAGYLHLDIQDGNAFLRGTLEDHSELLTLIDFGSARPMEGRKTAPITDRVIFTSPGYSAPEMLLRNDGTLQLGPEADIYSAGCLTYFLLTGHRPDIRQFLASKTGQYLHANDLRRIKCPPHLVERIQQILACALAERPEDRYHSAGEMLAEVNDLAEALQPYRTDLSGVKYDAFICYKHGPVDSGAALCIQKKLESFRYQHRSPFHRVFVDEGELASCADFGQQIRDALRNSGWLIVVCSPDTPSSPWVQREIEAFLETHDRSRILAALTAGEAAEAFPPQLLGDGVGGEVLAADARGDTLRAVSRKLRGDALLKLAAPMLGTTFDGLKQRQKTRTAQRAAGIASALTAAVLCFALYAANRAAVISRQADQLAQEYQKALVSESRILTQQAEAMLNGHDPTAALSLLLRALPSQEQDRPILPEAVQLLMSALHIYQLNDGYVLPHATHTLHFDSNIRYFIDSSYLYTYSLAKPGLSIRDAETFQLQSSLDLDVLYAGENLLLPESGGLLAVCVNSLVHLDVHNGKTVWITEIPDIKAAVLSEDHSVVYTLAQDPFTGQAALAAFSVETGEQLYSRVLSAEQNLRTQFCVSADGKRAAFLESDPLEATTAAILLINTENGEVLACENLSYCPEALQFQADALLFLGYEGEWLEAGVFGLSQPGDIRMEARSADTLAPIWSASEHTAARSWIAAIHPQQVNIHPELIGTGRGIENGIVFVYADRVILVNAASGQVMRSYPLPASVSGVTFGVNGLDAVTADGSYTMIAYPVTEYTVDLFFEGLLEKACFGSGIFYLKDAQIDSSDWKITRYAIQNNPNCIPVSADAWDDLQEENPQTLWIAESGEVTDETGAVLGKLASVPEFYLAGLTADGQKIWVLCKDDSIVLYDLADDMPTGCFSVLSLNTHLSSASRVQLLDDSTILLFTGDGCIQLDLSGDTPVPTAIIPCCTAYDPRQDRFLVRKTEDKLFSLHRYSLEELIALAQEKTYNLDLGYRLLIGKRKL